MKTILNILAEIRPEFDFAASSDFFSDGYLDSFDLITFVASLEKEHGVKIKGTDIVPENIMNVEAIQNLLKKCGARDAV